jgi:beta-lactam-binding protein with PASTA domain
MKDFIDFLKNRLVQKYLIITVVTIFLIIEFIFLGLKVYTRHGQALSVPDFSKLTLEEVSEIADLKKLQFEIVDSVFVQGQKPGTVVAQNPSPDIKVKVNRTIFLTINAHQPEMVKMPNVVGVSFRQAEARLLTNGLKVGARKYVPGIGKDYVLRQLYHGREINPGRKIVKGSSVDLVLSMGEGSDRVSVPDLKKLTLSKAREVVSNLYVNLGAVIYDNSIENMEDSLRAVIWKQSPDYGTSTNVGQDIDVWFTVDFKKAGIDTISN